MALTSATASDKAFRALQEQGRSASYDDILSSVPEALMAISREAMNSPHRAALETTLSLTLSAVDAAGLQTAPIGATVFEESVELVNDVYHTGVTHKFVYKPTIGHLLQLLSTSTTACYTRAGQTIYARRPSSGIATTASALKVKAVLVLTSLASLPVDMENLLIDRLILMGGGQVGRVAA
jgi:hypothetical protein